MILNPGDRHFLTGYAGHFDREAIKMMRGRAMLEAPRRPLATEPREGVQMVTQPMPQVRSLVICVFAGGAI